MRGRELISGVAGEFGHIGEADQRGPLAAPELGDLAIDKVAHEFDVKPFAGLVAFHGFNLTGGPDPHSTSNSAKIVAFNIVRSSLRHNIFRIAFS